MSSIHKDAFQHLDCEPLNLLSDVPSAPAHTHDNVAGGYRIGVTDIFDMSGEEVRWEDAVIEDDQIRY